MLAPLLEFLHIMMFGHEWVGVGVSRGIGNLGLAIHQTPKLFSTFFYNFSNTYNDIQNLPNPDTLFFSGNAAKLLCFLEIKV